MTTKASISEIRLNKYDNLRGLGIALVVLFHLMGLFYKFPIYESIGNLLATFMMPLLFFISGYFSKIGKNSNIKAFKGILMPYIIFNVFWVIFIVLVFKEGIPQMPFLVPVLGLWYLLCLFLMRLVLPILSKIKYMFWISLILALFIGIISTQPSNFLTITRFFGFLPAFLLGYEIKNYDFQSGKLSKFYLKKEKTFNSINKKYLWMILIFFVILVTIGFSNLPHSTFGFKVSYHGMGVGNILGMTIRFGVIITSIIIILLLNHLMTNKKTFLTKVGVNSLAVYILHFYFTHSIAFFFKKTFIGSIIKSNVFFSGIFLIVATVLIIFILSRDIVTINMKKIIDFFNNLILKKSENN